VQGLGRDEAIPKTECEHVKIAHENAAEFDVPVLPRHITKAFVSACDNGIALGAGEAGEDVHWWVGLGKWVGLYAVFKTQTDSNGFAIIVLQHKSFQNDLIFKTQTNKKYL